MNRATILAEIDAVAARLADLRRQVERDDDLRDPSPWMTVREYAFHAKVSAATVRRWVQEGMPAAGDGRLVRVQKEEADQWRSKVRYGSARTRSAGC